MIVENLTANNEKKFLQYLEARIPISFRSKYWYVCEKLSVKALLAIERGRVEGLAVQYAGGHLELFGSAESAEHIIKELTDSSTWVKFEETFLPSLSRRFQFEHGPWREINMWVGKGQASPLLKHEVREIRPEDSEAISQFIDFVELSRNAKEQWREYLRDPHFMLVGIWDKERLVSTGRAQILDDVGGELFSIETKKGFEGQGYATSVSSYLTKKVLERGKLATLCVMKNNHAAIHIYQKIGYKTSQELIFGKISPRRD